MAHSPWEVKFDSGNPNILKRLDILYKDFVSVSPQNWGKLTFTFTSSSELTNLLHELEHVTPSVPLSVKLTHKRTNAKRYYECIVGKGWTSARSNLHHVSFSCHETLALPNPPKKQQSKISQQLDELSGHIRKINKIMSKGLVVRATAPTRTAFFVDKSTFDKQKIKDFAFFSCSICKTEANTDPVSKFKRANSILDEL